jgi:hypothetical protein
MSGFLLAKFRIGIEEAQIFGWYPSSRRRIIANVESRIRISIPIRIAKHRSVIQILLLIQSRVDHDQIMLASGGLTPIAAKSAAILDARPLSGG